MSSLHHAVKSPVVARASIVVKDLHLLGGSYRQTPAANAMIGSHTGDPYLSPGEVIISSVPLESVEKLRQRGRHNMSPVRGGCPPSPRLSELSDDESQKQNFQRKGRFLVWPASFGTDGTISSSP